MYAVGEGNGSMATTDRDSGGGVLGFAIAFFAFALGGALGLPPLARLVVIGVGVLLAVLSAGMTGFGLAAVVLGGITLVSSMTLFGALGASPDLQVTPPIPTVDDSTEPQEDGGYVLTPYDRKFTDTRWSMASKAERRRLCARIEDGVSDAEMQGWVGEVEMQGLSPSEEDQVRFRAMLEYAAVTYC
jgi:hypothetical protein